MTLISSPGSTAYAAPAIAIAMNVTAKVIARPVRWPESFSSAIARRERGVAAMNSRLPRLASAARVADRARIDQTLSTTGKKVPYLYCR